MDTDTGMIPSSPSTETSRSSSDIATEVRLAKVFFPPSRAIELLCMRGILGRLIWFVCCQSTGSFFRDRSTTLGTLMGVSLADDEQGQGQHQAGQQDAGEERQRLQEADGWRWRRKLRRRLVEAVQGRRPRADVAGPLPGHGEAHHRRRAAVRRRRRR
jgi:hypothetical protein